MANEITAMISDEGRNLPCIVATGSVVAGDVVFAYQTSTDDMFAGTVPDPTTFTTGSVAIQRNVIGTGDDKVVGIALSDGASGDTISVATEGFFLGIGNAGVTPGEKIIANGQKFIDFSDAASGVPHIVGKAVTGTSAADKIFLFKLTL